MIECANKTKGKLMKIQNISAQQTRVFNGQKKSQVMQSPKTSIAQENQTEFFKTKINFKGLFEINNAGTNVDVSIEELFDRTSPSKFSTYKLLDVCSPEYAKLQKGDKIALKHLVKAARILDNVYLKQDNPHNIEFRERLIKNAKKGSIKDKIALILFDAQKGINAKDTTGKEINLSKKYPTLPQRGFYPEDLTEKEFHEIIISMLKEQKFKEVANILNQRTIVVRNGKNLRAVDYTDFFKKEFSKAADEILKAAQYSTNKDFNEFLTLQASALRYNNPLLDAAADKKWATLQNTPLEFTITRESYDDRLTPTITKNPGLSLLLKKLEITPYAKDTIGVRVGIVNKEGTDYLLKMKKFLPMMAENMPYKDEYEQNITKKDNKQTMVDVDIVEVTGQTGAYRGGISIASNLPNNDKLATKLGGGKRNVYHRQMRQAKYANNLQPRLDAVLDESFHKYFRPESLHDFTILHENIHSLGPKNNAEKLGAYKSTLEENKADMGALYMLDFLTQKGFYTKEQQKQIITSYLTAYVQKGPNFQDAHRSRNIMQYNFFIQEGAITFNDEGKMKIDFEKITHAAEKMLKMIIRLQIDGDMNRAQEYYEKYAQWNENLENLAQKLKKTDTVLNSKVISPLADTIIRK